MHGSQVPVAAGAELWASSHLRTVTASSKPGCLSLVRAVCGQIELSATGRSFVQRSPIKCGVSEYDLETSTMKRPRPTRGVQL